MAIDPSIALSGKGVNAQEIVDNLNRSQMQAATLKDMISQRASRDAETQTRTMNNSETARQQSGQKTARGLMQVNDVSTPEGLAQQAKDLTTLGYGDLAQEARTQGAQMSAAQTAAQEKTIDLSKKRQDLASQIYDAGNKYIANAAQHLQLLPPEQREQGRQSVLQEMEQLHLNPHDFAQAPLDDKTLTQFSRVGMSPKEKADLEYQDAGRDYFTKLKPAIDQKVQQLTTGPNGQPRAMNQTDFAQVNKMLSSLPPQVQALPEYKQYALDLEKNKMQPQPNMVTMSMAPVSNSVLDNAAQRIADRKSTLSEEISKGRWIGTKAMEMHDQLVNKVAALDPNFSEQETEAGAGYAKSPKTRNAIQQLDNAYSTVGRLKDVYAGLDNGKFPTLNKAINSGKVQMGDVNAARAAIANVLGNDELTQAFARGGTGSDKLRSMSEKLADPNGNPQQMAAQFEELLQGVKRSRQAYETQGAGYIKPMKESKSASTPGTVKTSSGKTYKIEVE